MKIIPVNGPFPGIIRRENVIKMQDYNKFSKQVNARIYQIYYTFSSHDNACEFKLSWHNLKIIPVNGPFPGIIRRENVIKITIILIHNAR